MQSDVVPDVLKFHDVGYLEFDEVTKLPKVLQSLRDELITSGPYFFSTQTIYHHYMENVRLHRHGLNVD